MAQVGRITFNLLGPQGSGKGTQADALLERYRFSHFDLGENLRKLERSGTPLGDEIASYIDHGHRVPARLIAEVTNDLLKTADPEQDILFDGMLRGLDEIEYQKATLASYGLPLPVIIFLNLDEDSAIERLSHRRICPNCGARYIDKTVCARCGHPLAIRNDDTPEAIRSRLAWYRHDTLPVIDYFREHGTVIDIDASPSIEQVTKEIVAAIDTYYQTIGKTPPRK